MQWSGTKLINFKPFIVWITWKWIIFHHYPSTREECDVHHDTYCVPKTWENYLLILTHLILTTVKKAKCTPAENCKYIISYTTLWIMTWKLKILLQMQRRQCLYNEMTQSSFSVRRKMTQMILNEKFTVEPPAGRKKQSKIKTAEGRKELFTYSQNQHQGLCVPNHLTGSP